MDYESVALPTELRRRTTAPWRTMQQRIVNRTPQTPLMTRVVGSSWTSVPCRAVPRMRFHLFECRRPWDMGAATVTTGSNRVSAAAPLTQLMPARRTNRAAPVASASVRQVSFRRICVNREQVSESASPMLTRTSNPAARTSRSN